METTHNYETRDVRRHRTYQALLSFKLALPCNAISNTHTFVSAIESARELREIPDGHEGVERIEVHAIRPYRHGRWAEMETEQYGFSLRVSYTLPSWIPDSYEEFAEVSSGSVESFEDLAATTIRGAFDEARERDAANRHRERVVRQANQIVEHLAHKAREEARRVCRYKQRLAALQAEYDAEREQQARELIDKIDLTEATFEGERIRITEDEDAEPEAVKAAVEALREGPSPASPIPGLGGNMPRVREKDIYPDDA